MVVLEDWDAKCTVVFNQRLHENLLGVGGIGTLKFSSYFEGLSLKKKYRSREASVRSRTALFC